MLLVVSGGSFLGRVIKQAQNLVNILLLKFVDERLFGKIVIGSGNVLLILYKSDLGAEFLG
jgi:hypothetical protein